MNFFFILLAKAAVALPAAPFWEGRNTSISSSASHPHRAGQPGCFPGRFVYQCLRDEPHEDCFPGRHFSLRAVVSTLFGESADSLIFFPIAFGGLLPVDELLKMMAVQALAKTLYEVLVLPVTVRVVRYVKRVDGSDVYDTDVSYNILKLKQL